MLRFSAVFVENAAREHATQGGWWSFVGSPHSPHTHNSLTHSLTHSLTKPDVSDFLHFRTALPPMAGACRGELCEDLPYTAGGAVHDRMRHRGERNLAAP